MVQLLDDGIIDQQVFVSEFQVYYSLLGIPDPLSGINIGTIVVAFLGGIYYSCGACPGFARPFTCLIVQTGNY